MTEAKPKILAIDDTPANLLVLGRALEGEFDLRIATSGLAGLKLAAEHVPDVILLDVMMPEMDGFETCRRLKADPRLSQVPVVFITALAELDAEATGLSLGAADYLTKPINVLIARQRIRNLVERERLRKAVEHQKDHLEALVRERTAALEQTVAELESFLYSTAHDLTTPLRAINGYAAILVDSERQNLSAEGRQLLDRIAQAANRLGGLIDGVLDYARAGRQPMRIAEVPLAPLLEAAARPLAERYPAVRLAVEPLPVVRGDPDMLARVLALLLDNAYKFSALQETPEVAVGVSHEDGRPAFFVRDNGVGLDMQYAGKLFTMFQRLHRDADFPGRGVGLAIARRLIERHGGRIWVEAAPGRGATFYFTLGEP